MHPRVVPPVGTIVVSEPWQIEEEAITSFARQWDPRPFHLDPATEGNEVFSGLVGSGLHALAISYRQFLDTGLDRDLAIAGLRLCEVEWLRPLVPGAVVQTRATVVEVRPGRRPDRALLVVELALTQGAEVVMTVQLEELVRASVTEGEDGDAGRS